MDGQMRLFGFNPVGRQVHPGSELTNWSELKFAHALGHVADIRDLMRSWDAGGHTWLELDLSEDNFNIAASLRIEASPPIDQLAMRLGDALHSFRGALDSLTWELCHLDTLPKPGVLNRIQFPTLTDPKKWDEVARTTLASMPADFKARLKLLQPFGATAPISGVQWLVLLSNQDKHRGAITATASVSSISLPITTGGKTGSRNGIDNGVRMNFPDSIAFEDGAKVLDLESSVALSLQRTRTAIGLEYVVSDGQGHAAELNQLLDVLSTLRNDMAFVREGLWPQAVEPTGASEAVE